jgi:hypothetical protein
MLPEDLHSYLSDPANLKLHLSEGEIRDVELYPAEAVPTAIFDVDTYEFYLSGEFAEDPAQRFEFDGYDLVKSCGSYSAEGILVWFPKLQAYGSWDCDHHKIMTYPHTAWTDIIRDPTWYLNGQWYPENVLHEYVRPWRNTSNASVAPHRDV